MLGQRRPFLAMASLSLLPTIAATAPNASYAVVTSTGLTHVTQNLRSQQPPQLSQQPQHSTNPLLKEAGESNQTQARVAENAASYVAFDVDLGFKQTASDFLSKWTLVSNAHFNCLQ